jgi:hypothetical protein
MEKRDPHHDPYKVLMTDITPAHLTKKLVESLRGEGLDPNCETDRRLARNIKKWLRWDSAGRHGRSPHFASLAITVALNYRQRLKKVPRP